MAVFLQRYVALMMRLPGKGAVDGRARDREQLGQIADRVLTGVVHAAQLAPLLVGELGLLASSSKLG